MTALTGIVSAGILPKYAANSGQNSVKSAQLSKIQSVKLTADEKREITSRISEEHETQRDISVIAAGVGFLTIPLGFLFGPLLLAIPVILFIVATVLGLSNHLAKNERTRMHMEAKKNQKKIKEGASGIVSVKQAEAVLGVVNSYLNSPKVKQSLGMYSADELILAMQKNEHFVPDYPYKFCGIEPVVDEEYFDTICRHFIDSVFEDNGVKSFDRFLAKVQAKDPKALHLAAFFMLIGTHNAAFPDVNNYEYMKGTVGTLQVGFTPASLGQCEITFTITGERYQYGEIAEYQTDREIRIAPPVHDEINCEIKRTFVEVKYVNV